MYYNNSVLIASTILLGNILTSPTAYADDFVQSITSGKAYADINSRYEYVDEDNTKKNANAGTIRTRLGYDTGVFNGFSGKAEFSYNTDVFGLDEFNSKQNGKTQYSVVADPTQTEVNQAYIDFTGLDKTRFRYGRQRIKLDQDRFVGNVGWRQNEQTYDALTVTNQSLDDLKITYGYIDKVQTFLDTRIDHNTHLFNVNYSGFKPVSVVGYYYGLENEDNQNQSSNTYGIQFKGKIAFNDSMSVMYLGEYANQKDAKDNSHDFNLDYYHVNAGMNISGFVAKAGYELLEGDGNDAFQTPLATKHAWNGWADKFLAVPVDGLEDFYLVAATKLMGVKVKAIYHNFESDKGNQNYGDELDVVLAKKLNKNYSLLLKYAIYDADEYSVDTEKLWLAFNAKFSQ